MSFNEKIMLNDGRQMPLLGLGVYKAVGKTKWNRRSLMLQMPAIVSLIPLLFTKMETVSDAGSRQLTIPRDELFVTTKIWNTAQRIGDVEDSFNRSLERLGLDYVDLYLVHWPVPGCYADTLESSGKASIPEAVQNPSACLIFIFTTWKY